MKTKNDIRYRFEPYLSEMREKDNIYSLQKRMIDQYQCYEIYNAKIYNVDLSILFLLDKVKLHNTETDKPQIVNGKDYLGTFLEGYKEGEQLIKPNEGIIYGSNADTYILDLHNKYYHNKIGISFNGWNFVKRINIHSFTHKEIREYGYYSGIVSVVDKMAIDYKKQFQKFEKCEHNINDPLTDFNFFKTAKKSNYNGVRFQIENELEEKRDLTPYTFLDYTFLRELEKCDNIENPNEILLILKECYSRLFDLNKRYNILGCEDILKSCEMKIGLVELEMNSKKSTKIPPPKDYDLIFKSIEVWDMFCKLHEMLVLSHLPTEKYANFSVIFQTLLEKKLIHKHKHRYYLDWIDTQYSTDFTKQTKLKSDYSKHSKELILGYLNTNGLINK